MYKSPTQDSCKMLQNVSFSKILLAQVFDHHMQYLNNTNSESELQMLVEKVGTAGSFNFAFLQIFL